MIDHSPPGAWIDCISHSPCLDVREYDPAHTSRTPCAGTMTAGVAVPPVAPAVAFGSDHGTLDTAEASRNHG